MSTVWEKFKALSSKSKVLCLLIPLMVIAAVVAWYKPSPIPAGPGFIEPPPISGTDVPKVDKPVKGGKVKVIPKDDVEDSVEDLPEEIKKPNTEVLATAKLAATENGYEVISTINTDTGESKLSAKELTPPLFAFENKKRIGAMYGVGSGGPVAGVFGEWSFLRVGNVHVSVQGELRATKTPEAAASVLLDYRF